jgi:VWFA-related protein
LLKVSDKKVSDSVSEGETMNRPGRYRINHLMIILTIFTFLGFVETYEPFFSSAKILGDGIQARQQKIKVIYQLTDVVVRDSSGAFVHGLGPDDFILEVDGERVEVKSADRFESVKPDEEAIIGYVRSAEDARELGREPPAPPTPPRFIIFVFDRFNMGEAALKASIETAKRIVMDSLLPYDRVAVFVYIGGLRCLTGLTTDRDKIMEAIESANMAGNNPNYRPIVEEILPKIQEIHEVNKIKAQLQNKAVNFQNFIQSMRSLAKAMKVLPGRKTYLLFSEGPNIFNPLGNNPGVSAGSYLSPHFVAKELDELARLVSSTNASIYTFKRGPLQPEWMLNMDIDVADRLDLAVNAKVSIVEVSSRMEAERVDVLRDAAALTNGKFFDAGFNEENLLGEISEEVGNYYVLGFAPPAGEAGDYRRIRVRMADKSYKVVHRNGYFEPKDFAEMDENERAIHLEEALMIPGILNELGLTARGYRVPAAANPSAVLMFQLESGGLSTKDDETLELEMVVAVQDTEGNIRYRTHRILRSDQEYGSNEQLWLAEYVPVPAEAGDIFLVVRDNVSGRRTALKLAVAAGFLSQDGLRPGDPIIMSSSAAGALADWNTFTVNDGFQPVDPLAPLHGNPGGKPEIGYSVGQGENALLLLPLGNLPANLDAGECYVSLDFELDVGQEKSCRLMAGNVAAEYLTDQRMMLIRADLPLGLAQRESGQLSISVSGIKGSGMFVIKVPYRIADFSADRAAELSSDERLGLNQGSAPR